LHGDKDQQTPFMGGPITRTTSPGWRTAAILEKKDNSSYLHNGLTVSPRNLARRGANWPSPSYRPLKIRTFKNSKCRKAAILKIEKLRYFGNGMTDRQKFGTISLRNLVPLKILSF